MYMFSTMIIAAIDLNSPVNTPKNINILKKKKKKIHMYD